MINNFLSSDGGKIEYQIQGEGEVLCFIHGFTLDKSLWEQQIEYFSKKYKVLSYDMRGFGRSSVPVDRYTHHQDLHDLLKHLDISSVTLIGLSLGGEIAIDFTLQFPKMVKKLIVINTSLGGFKSTVDWNVNAAEIGVRTAKQSWLKHAAFEFSVQNPEVKQKLANIISRYSGWHWLNSDLRTKAKPLAVDRLKEIKVPTLVMTGQNDLEYFQKIAELLATEIPKAKKVIIPEAGHLANFDNPTFFDQTIEKFL